MKSIVIMGVSGCGKSTIARQLAERLNARFEDADGYHPQANREKMAAGDPLTDADRRPWLESLRDLLTQSDEPIVLACSALKQSYRDIIGLDRESFIFLHGRFDLLLNRMTSRDDHFMPASLLESQLATLELPHGGLTIDIRHSPEEIVARILTHQPGTR